MTINDLILQLKKVLKVRNFPSIDDYVLELEVRSAIDVINSCRRFTPTDEKPYDRKYEHLIIPLCISSISKMGAEGQTSHSENGIVRGYENGGNYPTSILKQIKPLIK